MKPYDQAGAPVLLPSLNDHRGEPLRRHELLSKRPDADCYDERWLQKLIMAHPELLPVGKIDPQFGPLVPVCTELPLEGRYLDNLYLTSSGQLALVECKLWRNPEARRTAVAQIVEYAGILSGWSYRQIEEAVKKRLQVEKPGQPFKGLYELVCRQEVAREMSCGSEPRFIDAVVRNMRNGNCLLLIVGDGIREEIEALTNCLQRSGLHFTFGLIALEIYDMPGGGYLVQPRIPLRTTTVDRFVSAVQDRNFEIIGAQSEVEGAAPGKQLPMTMKFFCERAEQEMPGISAKLIDFINRLEISGVRAEFTQSSLVIRWYSETGDGWTLGVIPTSGQLFTDSLSFKANEKGYNPLVKTYIEAIASAVPGSIVKYMSPDRASTVRFNGATIRISSLLFDDARAQAWVGAIESLQLAIAAMAKSQEHTVVV